MNILGFFRGNNNGISRMDEVDINSITREEFHQKYFLQRDPLVIRNGAKDWPLMQKWTEDYLITQGGGYQCNIIHDSRPASSKDRTLLKHYFALHKDKSTLTLDSYDPTSKIFFLEDIALPNICFNEKDISRFFFYHANKNGGTLPHSHGDAFNILREGEKRWVMYDADKDVAPKGHQLMLKTYKRYPAGTHAKDWFNKDYSKVSKTEKAYECIQKKGDIVFVPRNYAHAVVNNSEVLGIVVEVIR